MKKIDALNQIVVAIFRMNRQFLEEGDQLVESLELTSARWQVLGAITLAEKPLTVPQIAQFMGVTRQSVQKQIDLMFADGLCEMLDNPEHARSKLYHLTSKGSKAFNRAMERSNLWITALGKNIDRKAIMTTLATLNQLELALKETTITDLITKREEK